MKTKQNLLLIAFFLYTISSFSQVVTHALFHQNTKTSDQAKVYLQNSKKMQGSKNKN